MDDIIFGLQSWSEKHDWWIPNMCPGDLMIDGDPVVPLTHGFLWYDIEIGKAFTQYIDKELALSDFKPHKSEVLYQYDGIKFVNLSEIKEKKYIYPVFVRTGTFFEKNKDYGFRFVNDTVIKDVKEQRCKIVFIFPYEAFINLTGNRDSEIIEKWCVDRGLTKDQVYYVHGDLNVPITENYTYIPVNSFQCWVPHPRGSISEYKPLDNRNLFLSYARRPHDHRLIFACELLKNNLLNRGIFTYLGRDKKDSVLHIRNIGYRNLIEYAEILDQISPIEYDIDLININPAMNVNHKHYSQTFLSVVLETQHNADVLFFSEKIWKPISVGQPFMIIAGVGYLKELRRRGYCTFGKWFDESYDNKLNLKDRIDCVISELNRLSLLSADELSSMRKEMEEILSHNMKLFKDEWISQRGNSNACVYLEVKKIWDSF
jgi:hypothetical protein